MSETVTVARLDREEVQLALRRALGHACYVSSFSHDPERPVIQVGTLKSDLIRDDKTGRELALFAKIPDVLAVQAIRGRSGYTIKIPEAIDTILPTKRYSLILETHQNQLLGDTFADLVKIDEVSLAMRPIKRILVEATEFGGYVAGKKGARRRIDEREPKYLSFLQQLGFIKKEDGRFVPGPELPLAVTSDTPGPSVYEQFLGVVLRRGSGYLTQVLHLAMIVPFLRVENAYFWPAHLANDKLHFTRDGLRSVYRNFYGARRDRIMFEDKVHSLAETGILEIEKGLVTGSERILKPLLARPISW